MVLVVGRVRGDRWQIKSRNNSRYNGTHQFYTADYLAFMRMLAKYIICLEDHNKIFNRFPN
eukprot:scaffold15450_cov94-Skeletonema_dohrnii-CCMP3373.AAC.2